MITFLLGLLKIIGIVLLVLLILVLLIAGIVLFVPIRYQGAGQLSEEKKEANGKITWLLKAVRCNIDYTFPEKPVICLKILWIDIFKLQEKRKQKSKKKSKRKQKQSAKAPKTGQIQETSQTESTPDAQTAHNTEATPDAETVPDTETASTPKEPLKEKIEKGIDKIKNIIYNIKYYIAIFQEEDTKQLLADSWEAIVKILKSIRPRVFELKGEFGFATPDTTGQAYGAYCMMMPMFGDHVELVPNFDEQVLRGNLNFEGRITVFVIVINALRILFDKRLQPLINKLKHGGN